MVLPRRRALRFTLASFALIGVFAVHSVSAGERPRAVIELFTSQGCSSCPPADALLAEFARDPNYVALSYAVQIWDYLGWRDTLGSRENTLRQRAYADARGDRRVYTPQAVVNGVSHAIGSSREIIEAQCAARASGAAARALSVPVELSREGAKVLARVAAHAEAPPARVLFVFYERRREVGIERGENRGRSIAYHNVVRRIVDAGPFTGEAASIGQDWPGGEADGVAVLVQAVAEGGGPGVILGAAQLR